MPSAPAGFILRTPSLISIIAVVGLLLLADIPLPNWDGQEAEFWRKSEKLQLLSLCIIVPLLLFGRRATDRLRSGWQRLTQQGATAALPMPHAHLRRPHRNGLNGSLYLLAAASHELRQPLQSLRIFTQALRATPLDDNQQRIVGYLEESGHVLSHVIDTLLDMTRLENGAIRAHHARIDAGDLFEAIRQEFLPAARRKTLSLRLRAPRQRSGLRTDPNLLRIVLRNLVGNAVKYTDRGGILLALRPRADHLAIQVWDTGSGIAAEYLPYIYDQFFRVPCMEREDGLGLGLSIVQRLTDLLGYELECRSQLGRGTLFEIRIPQAEQSLAARSRTPRQERSAIETSMGVS